MQNLEEFRNKLTEAIRNIQTDPSVDSVVCTTPIQELAQHSFLFFIKPELTEPGVGIHVESVLDFLLQRLQLYGFRMHKVMVLSGAFLKQRDLMAKHYGVISAHARLGAAALSNAAKSRFASLYGLPAKEANILGGDQFLVHFPFFNPHSLNCLWQNLPFQKLASGAYVQKVQIDRETVWLLNGFQPNQLEHFTQPGRCIVLFHISADLSWKDAREVFIGATDPQQAATGSLRRDLLDRKAFFGLPEVSQSYNGVHLSAGPMEALAELRRFEMEPEVWPKSSFASRLAEEMGAGWEVLLENPVLENEGKVMSVFDWTELMNNKEALIALQSFKDKCLTLARN